MAFSGWPGRRNASGVQPDPGRCCGNPPDPTHTGSPSPMPQGHVPIPRTASPAEAARKRFGRHGVLWGILSVSGAFAIFTLHDAGIKWLVAGYAPLQVLFIRSAVILIICICV